MLRTTTEVVALRENRGEGAAAGSRLLRIRTVDQEGRAVLDFTRCAMLPLRDGATGHAATSSASAAELADEPLRAAMAGLDLAATASRDPGRIAEIGDEWGASRAETSSTARRSSRG